MKLGDLSSLESWVALLAIVAVATRLAVELIDLHRRADRVLMLVEFVSAVALLVLVIWLAIL